MEIWKDIEGYEGLYQVSNYGNVRSLNYAKAGKVKELKQGNWRGYKNVDLWKNGKGKSFKVHRLVAQAFIENPNEYLCVNHKDENKQNNHVSNLEWCTHKYNSNYGTGRERVAKTLTGRKLSEEQKQKIGEAHMKKVQCLNNGVIFGSLKEACDWCGLKGNAGIISQIKGKLKTAGKDPVTKEPLQWQYVD